MTEPTPSPAGVAWNTAHAAFTRLYAACEARAIGAEMVPLEDVYEILGTLTDDAMADLAGDRLTDDQRAALEAIADATDTAEIVRLTREFYADADRAGRTPRRVLYWQIRMLTERLARQEGIAR